MPGLYHAAWQTDDGQLPSDKHEASLEILDKLREYIVNHQTRCLKSAQVVLKHVFLLDRSPFRDCAPLARAAGFAVTLTPWRRRTASEDSRNFSAEDDYALKRAALEAMKTVDAFVIVAMDGDYIATVDMIHHEGRLVLVGAYEREGHRLNRVLRQRADQVLPLRDIVLEKDEPVLHAVDEVEKDGSEFGDVEPGDKSFDLFHHARCLLRYPLHELVEIGRRSVSLAHFPHVDVTDYDPDRTVSRRHLCVRQTPDGCYVLQVHKTCSRGTWLNGRPILPGESVALTINDSVVFGAAESGFGLRLRDRQESARNAV